MKTHPNYLILFTFVFITTGIAIGILGYYKLTPTENKLNGDISNLFKEAIRINAIERTKNMLMAGNYNYDPSNIGTYEKQTIQFEDTVISFQHKIVNLETHLSNNRQMCLLIANKLHANDVKQILDSLLKVDNIDAKTTIAISVKDYPIKGVTFSEDKLNHSFEHKISYISQTDIAQIAYTACIDYPFSTIVQAMEKKTIYGITMAGLFLAIAILIIGIKDKSRVKSDIIVESNASLPALNEPDDQPASIQINNNHIIFKSNAKKISPQSSNILNLFLEDQYCRVNKSCLRELWPEKSNQTNNMTSAITRINKILNNIDAPYSIVTDPSDKDFYILEQYNSSYQ